MKFFNNLKKKSSENLKENLKNFYETFPKNPAYGRHKISRPMWIEAPMFFLLKKNSIQNGSLFLSLYESLDKCTRPLVENLPRMDNPCMQSQTIPCFQGSRSRSMRAPVHWSNTSNAWTIHSIQNNSWFLGLYKLVDEQQFTSQTPATRGRSMTSTPSFTSLVKIGMTN